MNTFLWLLNAISLLVIQAQSPEPKSLSIYISDKNAQGQANSFANFSTGMDFLISSLGNNEYSEATIFFTQPIEYYYPMRFNIISFADSSIKRLNFKGVASESIRTQVRFETLSKAVEYTSGTFTYENIEFLFSSIRGDADSLIVYRFCEIKFFNISIDFYWRGNPRLFLFNIIGGRFEFSDSEISGKTFLRLTLLRVISSNSSQALQPQTSNLSRITFSKCTFSNSSIMNSHASYYKSLTVIQTLAIINNSLSLNSVLLNITATQNESEIKIFNLACALNLLSTSSIIGVESMKSGELFRVSFTLFQTNFTKNNLSTASGFTSLLSKSGGISVFLLMDSGLFLTNFAERSSRFLDFSSIILNNSKFISNRFDSGATAVLISNLSNFFISNSRWIMISLITNILVKNNLFLQSAGGFLSAFKQDNIMLRNAVFTKNSLLYDVNSFISIIDATECLVENISLLENLRTAPYLNILNAYHLSFKNSSIQKGYSKSNRTEVPEGIDLLDIVKCEIINNEFLEPLAFYFHDSEKRRNVPGEKIQTAVFSLAQNKFLAKLSEYNQNLFAISLQNPYRLYLSEILMSVEITESASASANWISAPFSNLTFNDSVAINFFVSVDVMNYFFNSLEFTNCSMQINFFNGEISHSAFVGNASSMILMSYDLSDLRIFYKKLITLLINSSEIFSSNCLFLHISDLMNNMELKLVNSILCLVNSTCSQKNNFIVINRKEAVVPHRSFISFNASVIQSLNSEGLFINISSLPAFDILFEACKLEISNTRTIFFKSNPSENSSLKFTNTFFLDKNKTPFISNENGLVACICLLNASFFAEGSHFQRDFFVEGRRMDFNVTFVYQKFECSSCPQPTTTVLGSLFKGFSFTSKAVAGYGIIVAQAVFILIGSGFQSLQKTTTLFKNSLFSETDYLLDTLNTLSDFKNRKLHQCIILGESSTLRIENCIFQEPRNSSFGTFLSIFDGYIAVKESFFTGPSASQYGHSIFIWNSNLEITKNYFLLSRRPEGLVYSLITSLGSGYGNIVGNYFFDVADAGQTITSFITAGHPGIFGHFCEKQSETINKTRSLFLSCRFSKILLEYTIVFNCSEGELTCGVDSVLGDYALFKSPEALKFEGARVLLRKRHLIENRTEIVNISQNRFCAKRGYRVYNFLDASYQTPGVPFLTNFTVNPDVYENKDSIFSLNIRLCTSGFIFSKQSNSCVKCSQGKYSLSAVAEVCSICPDLADCYDGKLSVKESFWRPHKFSEKIYFCDRNPQSCLQENRSSDKILCQVGYKGPKCESCEYENGWVRFFELSCAKCNNSVTPFLMSILMFLFHVAFLFYTCYNWSVTINMQINRAESEENLVRSRRHMSLFLNILYFFLQMINVRITPRLENQTGMLNMILLLGLPSELFSYKYCIFLYFFPSNPLYADLIYIMLLPILKGLALMGFMKFLRKRKGIFKNSPTRHTYFLSLVILFNSEFYSLLSELFSFLSCLNIDGYYYVKKDIQFSCQDFTYQIFRAFVMIPGVILWACVFPFLIFYNITSNSKNLNSERNLTIFGSLTIGYQKHVFYWELCKFLFKMLILMINQFINYYPMRYIFYILLFLTYGFSVRALRPYYSDKFNRIEIIQSIILIILPLLELYGATILFYKRLDMTSLDITEGFVNFISISFSVVHKIIVFSYVFYLVLNIFIQLKTRLLRFSSFLGRGLRKKEGLISPDDKNIIGKHELMI